MSDNKSKATARINQIFIDYTDARWQSDTVTRTLGRSVTDTMKYIGVSAEDKALIVDNMDNVHHCCIPDVVDYESYIRNMYKQSMTQLPSRLASLSEMAVFGAVLRTHFSRHVTFKVPGNQVWTAHSWRALIHMARPHAMRHVYGPVLHIDGLDQDAINSINWVDMDHESSYSGLLVMTVSAVCKSNRSFLHGGVFPIDTDPTEFRMLGMSIASSVEPQNEIIDELHVSSVLMDAGQAVKSPLFAYGMYMMMTINDDT